MEVGVHHHRQGRVENTLFRYKQILGGKLNARLANAQEVEATLDCRILYPMGEIDIPKSAANPGQQHGQGQSMFALTVRTNASSTWKGIIEEAEQEGIETGVNIMGIKKMSPIPQIKGSSVNSIKK